VVFLEVIDSEVSNAEFLNGMQLAGVRMGQVRGLIRAVTHLDVRSEDIEVAIRAAADVAPSCRHGRSDGAAP
jgi:threonine aldolase